VDCVEAAKGVAFDERGGLRQYGFAHLDYVQRVPVGQESFLLEFISGRREAAIAPAPVQDGKHLCVRDAAGGKPRDVGANDFSVAALSGSDRYSLINAEVSR
jgi:hypothetical protein